jgi:hypothetical protein
VKEKKDLRELWKTVLLFSKDLVFDYSGSDHLS